jgi:hypothetical protein
MTPFRVEIRTREVRDIEQKCWSPNQDIQYLTDCRETWHLGLTLKYYFVYINLRLERVNLTLKPKLSKHLKVKGPDISLLFSFY